jgi:hypothetical protein
LDVNACCINVVVGIKSDVVATECWVNGSGKVSFTLATATIDKEAKRSTKTTVQLSNIDAGAGGISLTANTECWVNGGFFDSAFQVFGRGVEWSNSN